MSSSSTHLPVAEQATEEMLAALKAFLAAYRESGGGLR
jgi:hypothetical protein